MKPLRSLIWGLIASLGATQANAAIIRVAFSGEFTGGTGNIADFRVRPEFSGLLFFDTEAAPDDPGAVTQTNYLSSVISGELTMFGDQGPNRFVFDEGRVTVANNSPSGSNPDRFSWFFRNPVTVSPSAPDFFASDILFTINGADSILSDLSLSGAADALMAEDFTTLSTAINVLTLLDSDMNFSFTSATGNITSYEATISAVPEPSSALLSGLAMIGLIFRRRS